MSHHGDKSKLRFNEPLQNHNLNKPRKKPDLQAQIDVLCEVCKVFIDCAELLVNEVTEFEEPQNKDAKSLASLKVWATQWKESYEESLQDERVVRARRLIGAAGIVTDDGDEESG